METITIYTLAELKAQHPTAYKPDLSDYLKDDGSGEYVDSVSFNNNSIPCETDNIIIQEVKLIRVDC